MTNFYNKCCDDKYIYVKMFSLTFAIKWFNLYDLNNKKCRKCPKLLSYQNKKGHTILIHFCMGVSDKKLLCSDAHKQLKEFQNIKNCRMKLK